MSDPAKDLLGLLHELRLPDDIAELRHFTELCRSSLTLRSWLFARFAREPEAQEAFREILDGGSQTSSQRSRRSSKSTRITFEIKAPPILNSDEYGGLTKDQILELIVAYQFEHVDLKTFMLVRMWHGIGRATRTVPVSLWRPTLDHWRAMVNDSSGQLFREAAKAVEFFHERKGRSIGETDFGYNSTWKIHVLLHILEHPQPRYQVAALLAALPLKYQGVDRGLVRRFCQRHNIRRDTRPGERPGTRDHSRRDFGRCGVREPSRSRPTRA